MIGDDVATIRATAVDDWWNSLHCGNRAFLLAGTRSEAAALNHLARSRAATEGALTGPTLEVNGRSFQAGDRVLLGRNDARRISDGGQVMRVDNGMLGTIARINDNGTTSITLDGTGDTVVLQRDYLASGWLDHGYAMTIHKSQGATCDEVFVVGPAGLYREAAYVATSRARLGARLYATVSQMPELTEPSHVRGIPLPDDHRDPEDELIERIERSEAKTLAITRSPHSDAADRLEALPLHVLNDRLLYVRTVEAQLAANGLIDPAAKRATNERAAAVRLVLAVGRRVRALDRDNVGTVDAIDDVNGLAGVTFLANDGRTASRSLAWAELKVIDSPKPVELTPAANALLTLRLVEVQANEARWSSALSTAGVSPSSNAELSAAVRIRSERVTADLIASSPRWLATWFGLRPADAIGAATWDDAVSNVATWRDRHGIDPGTPGLGPVPIDPADAQDWRSAIAAALDAHTWLANQPTEVPPVSIPPMHPSEIAARMAGLDVLFASAPPDCRGLTRRLIDSTAVQPDIHDELVEARRVQSTRQDWILTNWPHIVEREQLGLVAVQSRTTASTERVQACLEALRRTVVAPTVRDERSIADLLTMNQADAPDRDLDALTSELARVDTTLAGSTKRQGNSRDFGDSITDGLRYRRAALVAEVVAERRRFRNVSEATD